MGWGAKLIIIPSTGGMNIFWNNNIILYDRIIVRGLNPGVICYITRFSMIVRVEVVLNSTVVFDSDRLVLCTKINMNNVIKNSLNYNLLFQLISIVVVVKV